jgi:metal-responsive CopG/Arc/MetJ family transcriptional regulator|tara:strand:+ start:3110 stop:3349 length:240 start_codon:yes stop_codon:yes gene_type:complete
VPEKKLYRTERLQVMLDENELELIDEWRFDKRIPSRAAAIRELIARGLATNELPDPERMAKSTDYTVTDEVDTDSSKTE